MMFEIRKIGIVKRASAGLLDLILLAVLATGIMWIISLICDYSGQYRLADQYNNEWKQFRTEEIAGENGVAQYYGYTYEETDDGYRITKDGQPAKLEDVINELIKSEGKDEGTAQAYAKYQTLTPAAKVDRQTQYVMTLLFMMTSIGIFLAYLILEFILPIILKNGQTVGKKVFSICLVRPNCVKVANIALFARAILGKYAVETMFPVLLVFLFLFGGLGWIAIALFGALLLLDLILFFATRNKTPIHDLFAGTVVADMKLQMIFDSEEELNEKKALLQKESVERSKEQ